MVFFLRLHKDTDDVPYAKNHMKMTIIICDGDDNALDAKVVK